MPSSSQAARPLASRRRPEGGIDPGARHDLGAERRRARIQHLDLATDLVGADQLLLDQQLANRRLHDVVVAGLPGLADLGMSVVMPVVVIVVLRRASAQILSSQVSNTSMRSPSRGEPT